MGKSVYEMADPFIWVNDDYEFQVPIFVLTHTPPAKYPKGNDKLSLTFVTDGVESAISQAKKAAGDKDALIIGGAGTIQQCLNSGLCDELQLDIMPVLLGKGLRLLENIDTDKIKLERITDAGKTDNLKREFDILDKAASGIIKRSDPLYKDLYRVNSELWDIEDHIRDLERKKDFSTDFISTARAVYIKNDRRSELKREINIKTSSGLMEEKSYEKY